MTKNNNTFFTLISPIYNEENTVEELVERTIRSMDESGLLEGKKWEYILVDDHSEDSSSAIISRMKRKYPDVVIGIRHKKQLGQGKALRTGFFLGKGKIFGTLDSDLEKLPEDTPKLLREYIEKNCDLVCAYIENKNLISRVGNGILRFLFGHKTQQASTNQMIIGASFIKKVNLIKNDQRYVLPIAMSMGARKMSEVRTGYAPRNHGKTKYNIYIKAAEGLPEMLSLKMRVRGNFYKKLLTEEYRNTFEIIK